MRMQFLADEENKIASAEEKGRENDMNMAAKRLHSICIKKYRHHDHRQGYRFNRKIY
jgi:hypothetical protein